MAKRVLTNFDLARILTIIPPQTLKFDSNLLLTKRHQTNISTSLSLSVESDQDLQMTSNNSTNLIDTVSLNSKWNLADSFWSRVV